MTEIYLVLYEKLTYINTYVLMKPFAFWSKEDADECLAGLKKKTDDDGDLMYDGEIFAVNVV